MPLVFPRVEPRVDPWALVVAAAALPAAAGLMYALTATDVSDWPIWYLAPMLLGCLLLAASAAVEAARRGVWTGVGAPLVALLASAGVALTDLLTADALNTLPVADPLDALDALHDATAAVLVWSIGLLAAAAAVAAAMAVVAAVAPRRAAAGPAPGVE